MTTVRATQPVIDSSWFYGYVRDWIENTPESDPAKIKDEIMEEGFTWDEALVGVEAMLTDYVRRVQSNLTKQSRKRLGSITEPDDAFDIAFDRSLTEKQRRAKERDRLRQVNRAKINLEAEWQRFLDTHALGFDHKTWREMTVEDLDEYIKIRHDMARTNTAEAQSKEIVRAYMKEHKITTVGDLTASVGQELFAL